MTATARRWSTLGIRVVLGVTLFAAGFSKVSNAWSLAMTIANYRLLSPASAQILSVVLPWLEILLGVLLLAGVWVRASALLSLMLMIAFAAAIGLALGRGMDIECGCFAGLGLSRLGWRNLTIDGLLGLLAVALLRLEALHPDSQQGDESRPELWAE
jgi:uncharacterized membrane protein YphA (DoxX/SURF4 family)